MLSVHEFAGRNWHLQDRKRIMMNEITQGIDELGVLLAGHAKNAYWYGSQLSIGEARGLAPYNSATSLQVTSAALAGMIWAMENPQRGIVEPDDMDYRASAADLPALPGAGGGQVHGLDAAVSARRAVRRGSGHRRIPGNSRTFGWFEAVADGDHRQGGRALPAAPRVISSSSRLPMRLRPNGESMLM